MGVVDNARLHDRCTLNDYIKSNDEIQSFCRIYERLNFGVINLNWQELMKRENMWWICIS